MVAARVLSWNLQRFGGADAADVAALLARIRPDLVLLQEVRDGVARGLAGALGGTLLWRAFEGREHGPAAWSREVLHPLAHAPFGAREAGRGPRHACAFAWRGIGVSCVHLDHHPVLNRRQLREAAAALEGFETALVGGDTNMLGPCLLPGFREVGPRAVTHRAWGVLPVRLDRFLARGLCKRRAGALPHGPSDHRPVLVDIGAPG